MKCLGPCRTYLTTLISPKPSICPYWATVETWWNLLTDSVKESVNKAHSQLTNTRQFLVLGDSAQIKSMIMNIVFISAINLDF